MEFSELRDRLAAHFELISRDAPLFDTDIDRDRLYQLYLDSFPEGTNPLFRKRREYDCSCCRQFIRRIGAAVSIDADYTVHSIFEFDAGDPVFQAVMDALDRFVTGTGHIVGRYWSVTPQVGARVSHEAGENGIITWDHLWTPLPDHLIFRRPKDELPTEQTRFRDTRDVFRRSLGEISLEAVDTVLELVRSNSLYRGEEWQGALSQFRGYKVAFDALDDEKRELFCWLKAETVGQVVGRIRNHSMGVLLTDITNGMALDVAVQRYEAIVAPTNYKRPKPVFTQKMLDEARETIEALGYMDALPRRFATLDDISVNDILFSNRDAGKRIRGGSIFDLLAGDAQVDPRRFNRVEEIPVDRFISNVLPGAREVEAFFESRHAPCMVSLIAPVNRDAPSMFKWDNGFSWAYAGNLTDSDIRENVKNAGGRVDGVLRFSLQWNDRETDLNDLDAHCYEPQGGDHIYFRHKQSARTKGVLDVDIIHPVAGTPAVENITWPERRGMLPGTYQFKVYCYTHRGGRTGFRAEIEFDGQVYRYDYTQPLKQEQSVPVADVTLHPDGSFTIEQKLDSQASSREIWGVKTNRFVPVSVIMYSPNYWDGADSGDTPQGTGNRHYLFMLKDCVNPEKPNGFYNEFLKNALSEHKRVFEALGGRMAVEDTPDQLSGLGFASTRRNSLIVKVKGATERVMKILF